MEQSKSYKLFGYVISENEFLFGKFGEGTTEKKAVGYGKMPCIQVKYASEYKNSGKELVKGVFIDNIDVIEYSDEKLIQAFNEGKNLNYCKCTRAEQDEDGKNSYVHYTKVYVDKNTGKIKRGELVFVVEKAVIDVADITTDIFARMV